MTTSGPLVYSAEPAAKLPLISRKDIRDNYEAAIPDLTEQVKSLLGEAYTFEVDFPQLYSVVNEDYRNSLGSAAKDYFEGFVYRLKMLTEDGSNTITKSHFNEFVTARKIRLGLDEQQTEGYYSNRIFEGVYEINAAKGNFWSNTSYACEKMAETLDKAVAEKDKKRLPMAARLNLKEAWEEKKAELEGKIAEELEDQPITLTVDPAALWAALVDYESSLPRKRKSEISLPSLAANLGTTIFQYFDGLRYYMNYKFDDPMVVEAFFEAVTEKEARLEILKEGGLSEGRGYNDCVVEGGRLVIRTTAKEWGSNAGYATDDILKLL